MFSLPEKVVYNLVSKMMMTEELHGSWDQPTRTIVMHNLDASRLQQLTLQFADKAMVMIDLNERALAYRTGVLRDNDDEGGAGSRRRGGNWNEEESSQGRSRGGVKLAMVRNTAIQGRVGSMVSGSSLGGNGSNSTGNRSSGLGGLGGSRSDRERRPAGMGGGASYRSGGYGSGRGYRSGSQNMSNLGYYKGAE
jgi:translation initiation factor 3 subunit C